MESKLPAVADEGGLALAVSEEPAAAGDASRPIGQNVAVALLPLAIISLLVISFAAAAWTFLSALAGG